jgi:hypothetical protein
MAKVVSISALLYALWQGRFQYGDRYRSKAGLPNALQYIHFTEQVSVPVIFYICIQKYQIRIMVYIIEFFFFSRGTR